MKTLVVSDLHANAEALKAVMKRLRRKRIDRVICLGDFVGYGGQPNQVLDVMRTMKGSKLYIRGNHDRVAAGIDDAAGFNHAAKSAAIWTRDHLSGPNRRFVQALPQGPVKAGDLMLCHGSPYDEDEYVFTETHAAMVFKLFDAAVIFYGHTHLPVVFATDAERSFVWGAAVGGDATVRLEPGLTYLINPGSVGQPRDRNPMASFAVYDDEKRTMQFLRVEYDIAKAQAAILKAGLPRILADRLAVGT